MPTAKKTFNVQELKDYANKQLARNDNWANQPGFKEGIVVMIEHVLHAANVYKGFNGVYWIKIGCKLWEDAGRPQDNTPYLNGEVKDGYGPFARKYY